MFDAQGKEGVGQGRASIEAGQNAQRRAEQQTPQRVLAASGTHLLATTLPSLACRMSVCWKPGRGDAGRGGQPLRLLDKDVLSRYHGPCSRLGNHSCKFHPSLGFFLCTQVHFAQSSSLTVLVFYRFSCLCIWSCPC